MLFLHNMMLCKVLSQLIPGKHPGGVPCPVFDITSDNVHYVKFYGTQDAEASLDSPFC